MEYVGGFLSFISTVFTLDCDTTQLTIDLDLNALPTDNKWTHEINGNNIKWIYEIDGDQPRINIGEFTLS